MFSKLDIVCHNCLGGNGTIHDQSLRINLTLKTETLLYVSIKKIKRIAWFKNVVT